MEYALYTTVFALTPLLSRVEGCPCMCDAMMPRYYYDVQLGTRTYDEGDEARDRKVKSVEIPWLCTCR